MWFQNQDHVIKNYKQLPHNMHYIAKTSVVPKEKKKLIQVKQGTQECYVKIIIIIIIITKTLYHEMHKCNAMQCKS